MAKARTTKAVAATTNRAAKHATSRLLTYAPAWLIWLLVLPLAGLAYMFWGRNPAAAPWMSMAAMASVGGLTLFTWRALRARDEMSQWLGTVSAGLAGAWFIVAMLVSPVTRGVIDAWGFGGLVFCVAWSIRRAVINGALEQGGANNQSKLDKVLAGARISRPKHIDGTVVADVELDRGEQTVSDLQGSRDHIAGVLAVRPDAVRITPDPKDAGRAKLTVVPNDPLEGTIAWPGPTAPGRSIGDAPVAIGLYEDFAQALIWLCGDDEAGRALAHWLIMGMNGAGKSQAWVMAMADALTRTDVVLWGSDHVKGRQTFGPLLDAMDWPASTLRGAKDMIAAAREVAAARQDDLGRRGYKQWEPGCGLPLLIVWIEEASEIVSDSTSFVRLVERARSAGVVIVVSLQRASHDNIDTSARAQLAAALCFGVRDGTDSTFALPDNVLDAGAAPDSWGNRKPGYAYLVAPGLDEERWPVPLRTFRAFDPHIAKVLAEWAHVRANLDTLSINAAGAAYARRDVVIAGSEVAATGEDAEMVDNDNTPIDEDDDGMVPMPPTLEPELNVNPDEPIGPPPVEVPFDVHQPAQKLTDTQARAVVQQHLRTLAEQGRTHTQPAHVCAMKPATTRSREWVRLELKRLCTEAGAGEIRLERDDADSPGVYRIVSPALTGA